MEESALDDKVKAFPEVRSMGFWSGIWRTRIALATSRSVRINTYLPSNMAIHCHPIPGSQCPC
jgi:hypothetical protein